MAFEILDSPVEFLEQELGEVPHEDTLRADETWWKNEGKGISDAIDRGGTPWLRMFDRLGARVDEVLFPPEYWKMLRKGYQSGAVWRG